MSAGPQSAGQKRDRSVLGSRAVQAAFVIALVGLWYIGTTYGQISPILLPNPVRVFDELVDVLATLEFVSDLRVTLFELAVAFSISATGGIVLGYLISRSQYSIRVFEPLVAGIYSVPVILFLPLYILFFGLGPASKIALGVSTSFFPIILNTIAGFGYVERVFVLSARSMGASDYQLFRWVLLPAAFEDERSVRAPLARVGGAAVRGGGVPTGQPSSSTRKIRRFRRVFR